jgi:hypothetical protein
MAAGRVPVLGTITAVWGMREQPLPCVPPPDCIGTIGATNSRRLRNTNICTAGLESEIPRPAQLCSYPVHGESAEIATSAERAIRPYG